MKSHFDPTLHISLLAPDGWERARTDDFPLLLLAPRESNFRSNLGFSRAAAAAPDAALLERTIAAARAQQQAEYAGFTEIAEERFEQDGYPTFLQRYTWRPERAPEPFSQVFGLVLTSEHGLVEINGATVQSLAERALPAFEAIIRSLRFIPPSRT